MSDFHFHFPWWLGGKDSACSAGDAGEQGLIPGGEEMATHSSILDEKNPLDGGAWRTTVYSIEKNQP